MKLSILLQDHETYKKNSWQNGEKSTTKTTIHVNLTIDSTKVDDRVCIQRCGMSWKLHIDYVLANFYFHELDCCTFSLNVEDFALILSSQIKQ